MLLYMDLLHLNTFYQYMVLDYLDQAMELFNLAINIL